MDGWPSSNFESDQKVLLKWVIYHIEQFVYIARYIAKIIIVENIVMAAIRECVNLWLWNDN